MDKVMRERLQDLALLIEENENYREYSKGLKEISNEAEKIGEDVANIALKIAYREGFFDAVEFIRAIA